MRGAHEGESSVLDQTVEETNWQNTLDYAKDVYKFSFNPPLACIREARDKAFATFSEHAPKWLGGEREKYKDKLYDTLQADIKKRIERAHEEAVAKALAVIDFATRVVGSRKQELKRALMEFMTNQYEGFEDAQCRRAMERAVDVFNSAFNPPTYTMSDTFKKSIGSVATHGHAREGKNQSVQEADYQSALDHAKDVYKSFFEPPRTMLQEAHAKARAAFNDVAVGAGGPGSIRKKYKLILRDIRYKAYEDAKRKSHEWAASNALAAFDSRVRGAVGCVEQQYKSRLEDFIKNEYEGCEEAEQERIMALVREILHRPLDA